MWHEGLCGVLVRISVSDWFIQLLFSCVMIVFFC